jgi:hypothetical protein
MRLAAVAATSLLLATATPALADLPRTRGNDMVITEPGPRKTARDANGPDTLFLDRCVGGCQILSGGNDATSDHSSIPSSNKTLSEFQYTDEIWNAVVTCVEETYAPYGIEVVTVEPTSGNYNEVKVAGSPAEMSLEPTTLGIAPMAGDCSPQVNWIAFAFANAHGSDPVLELCATVAHEAGHIYGLDHEFDCKDPMTYLTGCGQKWFINEDIRCGEFEDEGDRNCRCGQTQNSHTHLTSALGEGTLPPPATVSIPYPTDGSMVSNGFTVFGEIDEPRVIHRVEFWLNGFPWKITDGQRDVAAYSFVAPGNVPDGVIDIEVRSYNDLEVMGSTSITVQKGAPCTSADTCLDGQECSEGRCAWPAPTRVQGETCAIDADCVSYLCATDGENNVCAERCLIGVDGACDDGFTCLEADGQGICWPSDLLDDGGCCDASGGDPRGVLLLGTLVGLAFTRRRRR